MLTVLFINKHINKPMAAVWSSTTSLENQFDQRRPPAQYLWSQNENYKETERDVKWCRSTIGPVISVDLFVNVISYT